MHILKSAFVIYCLLSLFLVSGITVANCVKAHREKLPKIILFARAGIAVCVCCFSIFITAEFGDYVNPFERTLQPTLIAEYDVPEEYEMKRPGERFWHGAYEAYDFYAASFWFDPNNKQSRFGFAWPPMDFEHYCYIITYGQKIESLSYNVWETIDAPVRTGAKVGHMILDEEFLPEKVYVYQIPKVRIENDINDVNSPWD